MSKTSVKQNFKKMALDTGRSGVKNFEQCHAENLYLCINFNNSLCSCFFIIFFNVCETFLKFKYLFTHTHTYIYAIYCDGMGSLEAERRR